MTRLTEAQHPRLAAMVADTDAVVLNPIEHASGVGRPSSVPSTFAEQEYDALANEQRESWTAEGEVAARKAGIGAAGLATPAQAASTLLSDQEQEVVASREQFQHASETLTPFVRRSAQDHIRYLAGWVILGLGDTAGVLAAAILLGEVPVIALGQALATGFAAVTAGQAGSEFQERRQAETRRKAPEELTDDQRRYGRLFVGPDHDSAMFGVVSWVALSIVLLISIGIFGLRSGTEGVLAGLTFGALAAATALASFISSYMHADEVADLIGQYYRRYTRARRRFAGISRWSAFTRRDAYVEEAASILREYSGRGSAAGHSVSSLKHRMLRRNPQVVGHGEAATEAAPVGRKSRTEGVG